MLGTRVLRRPLRRGSPLSILLVTCFVAPRALAADNDPPPANPAPTPPAAAPAPAVPPPAPYGRLTPPTPAAPTITTVDPARDQQELAKQGEQRPVDSNVASNPNQVFSDDWWGRTRPIIEIHGYFRTRGELFHNFTLGRHEDPGQSPYLWNPPLDNTYQGTDNTQRSVAACGGLGTGTCYDKSQASANMRFRINPEIHISDNLRILSQIDALDNIVLGSTPNYLSGDGHAPIAAFSTTQGPPTAGVNSFRNSIDVKRAWGEYQTPVGQVRFGRMPHHWGLGMMHNAGDGIDSDYQSTIDRIAFVTGVKSIDLYFGGSWDFPATGPTSATTPGTTSGASPYLYGGQSYSTGNLLNVDQWSAFIAKRSHPELQRRALARNELVVNGGVYTIYRKQELDLTYGKSATYNPIADRRGDIIEHRGAQMLVPDVWIQALWNKFRFEAEAAAVYGDISTISLPSISIRQYGVTTQTEYRAMEDKLRLQFGFGWASGDKWASTLNPGNTFLGRSEVNQDRNSPLSTFQFHSDYRVDLIFFRNLLSRVEGAYYFRPSVDYDFMRSANGQKFGGGAAIIWSRASEFIQSPGHKRDLGVELDVQLYYQAKDGSLNDDPNKVGGFFSMLQYGVFFPLGGLEYATPLPNGLDSSASAAQTVRLFLGIAY